MAHRIFTVARVDLAIGDHLLVGKGDERSFVRVTGIDGDLVHFAKRESIKLTGKNVQILDTLSLLIQKSQAKPQGGWTPGGRRAWVSVADKMAAAAARKAAAEDAPVQRVTQQDDDIPF